MQGYEEKLKVWNEPHHPFENFAITAVIPTFIAQ